MYIAPAGQLEGLNIFKAVGRALGSTGRAIVGAVVPGIGAPLAAALDSAAHGKSVTPVQADNLAKSLTPPAVAPPAAAPVATVTPPSGAAPSANDELMKVMLTKFITSQPVQQPAPQMMPQGGAPSIVVSSPGPSAPAAAAMPPWAIPAMIGALGLMFVMSQKR